VDPNETLTVLRKAAFRIMADPDAAPDAEELAEAIQNLDEWITNGGFLPREWERTR
jgi:hypothetical protein